ncbi:hypothetical protein VTO73DRAFT_12964 [Trametes versicolor]
MPGLNPPRDTAPFFAGACLRIPPRLNPSALVFWAWTVRGMLRKPSRQSTPRGDGPRPSWTAGGVPLLSIAPAMPTSTWLDTAISSPLLCVSAAPFRGHLPFISTTSILMGDLYQSGPSQGHCRLSTNPRQALNMDSLGRIQGDVMSAELALRCDTDVSLHTHHRLYIVPFCPIVTTLHPLPPPRQVSQKNKLAPWISASSEKECKASRSLGLEHTHVHALARSAAHVSPHPLRTI